MDSARNIRIWDRKLGLLSKLIQVYDNKVPIVPPCLCVKVGGQRFLLIRIVTVFNFISSIFSFLLKSGTILQE